MSGGAPGTTQVQRQYTMFDNSRVNTLDGRKSEKVGKNVSGKTTAD